MIKLRSLIRETVVAEAGAAVDKLSNSERSKISSAFAKAGVDGNGRFEKKEHGIQAVSQALSSLGFQLDMVSGDLIMGEKGSRTLRFRRANAQGQDPFTEQPAIENSYIVFNWENLSGPGQPARFEVQCYAS
jgi:hypothetical protein